MFEINENNVKSLNGETLSTIVVKYGFRLYDFLTDNIDCEEMSLEAYDMLKDHKVSVRVLVNDYNYDFVIKVGGFSAYCIYF